MTFFHSNMNRRRLLALFAGGSASLAGCSALGGDGDDDPGVTPYDVPRGTDDRATDEPTGTPERTPGDGGADGLGAATVAALETGPRTVALPARYRGPDGGEVRIELRSTATADGPLTVRGTLRNGNDWPNTFRLRALPPFGDPYGRPPADGEYARSDSLVFAPVAESDLVESVPGRERGREGYWRLTETGTWLPDALRLAADESVSADFAVLGHPDGEGRPPGRYRWRGGDRPFAATVWDSAAPGPDDGSRFGETAAPALPGGDVRWYHEADAAATSYLEPSRERVSLPARVEFTLYNHGRDPLGGNPYDWRLSKFDGGTWFRVAPWEIPAPYTAIPPGGTESWAFGLFGGESPAFPESEDVGHLGGGRYALRVGFSRERDGEDTPSGHAALLEVEAPPVDVVPTDDATVVGAEDGTVTVRSERHGDGRPATLTVARASGDADRVIPEQVLRERFRGLRNSLPYFDRSAPRGDGRVERVRLRTDERTAGRVVRRGGGGETARFRFRFDGATYEATVGGDGDRTETPTPVE